MTFYAENCNNAKWFAFILLYFFRITFLCNNIEWFAVFSGFDHDHNWGVIKSLQIWRWDKSLQIKFDESNTFYHFFQGHNFTFVFVFPLFQQYTIHSKILRNKNKYYLGQARATSGSRATCGPPSTLLWPAITFYMLSLLNHETFQLF